MKSIFLLIIGIVLGWLAHEKWSSVGNNTEIDSSIVLNRIKSVSKLITVEADFDNVMTYKDHYWFDFGPFKKQAIVKMKARVACGYNLENMKITADETTKTIHISNVPEPEVLSVDSDVKYYDVQEGLFNDFNAQELTQIQNSLRDFLKGMKYIDQPTTDPLLKTVREQAKKQYPEIYEGTLALRERAKKEGISTLKTIEMIAEAAGWKVVYDNAPVKLVPKG